jgi:hypothetical protein
MDIQGKIFTFYFQILIRNACLFFGRILIKEWKHLSRLSFTLCVYERVYWYQKRCIVSNKDGWMMIEKDTATPLLQGDLTSDQNTVYQPWFPSIINLKKRERKEDEYLTRKES